ncbi:hypothetical protein Q4F19_15270 [Sphingomonas sp. BIUV-7]|uniref:Periplasmic heavy metal sensor n=1 Tax=Sphingomonas natans TaxID=3063330 RepID=A0ABT8YBQ6_9SPHN|nr:hypothetical protein [Sphingomonas sp. BIUV-7]MDO6415750.1 hypothetical protein [Sphingomonas sp. BIUV-7]
MRRVDLLALALAGLATVPALAQTPPAPAAPARRPTNLPGVSPAGNAILTKLDAQGDPQYSQLRRQQTGLKDQLSNAIMVPTVDVDRVATIMRQMDVIQSQMRTRASERVLTALKTLPEADRGPFLRAIAKQVGPAAN